MATYYISPSGNDSNNGTSTTTPWKTIGKVNTMWGSIKAGDQILFQKDQIFRGSLSVSKSGTSSAPITIGSYGTGSNPQFLGSQKLTWTLHQGNIWKSTLSATTVPYMFQGDTLLSPARYPNTGWLRNQNGSATQINDSNLTQPDGYWNGADIIIRSSLWSYHKVKVTSYTKGKLTFPSVTHNLSNRSWGYFLCNKLSELNTPGEWFWDSSSSTVYVWCKDNLNPNNANIEVSTVDSGVKISSSRQWINLQNIDCKFYTDRALIISGSNNKIENCSVISSNKGLTIYGSNNSILNNKFTDVYATCLQITGGENNIIESNQFLRCGLVPGLGENSWGYFGIRASGLGSVIRKNTLSKMGYIGIVFSDNILVEENYIEDCCLTLTDGSGIAFDNVDGAIVRKNTIVRSTGNIESCALNFAEGQKPKGNGIYFGNISLKNTLVTNNTVGMCNGSGIWVDHTMVSVGNKITNNTLFGNTLCQIGFSDYSNYNGPGATSPYIVTSYNDVVTGNILYSTSSSQLCMYHINRWYSGVNFGQFNNNYYSNTWNTYPIIIDKFLPVFSTNPYTFSGWKSLFNSDSSSTLGPLKSDSNPNDHILIWNSGGTSKTETLPPGLWKDILGNVLSGSVILDPYTSKVLYKGDIQCNWVLGNPGEWSNCVQIRKTPYVSSILGCDPLSPQPPDFIEEKIV
jgi:hypothetical protein